MHLISVRRTVPTVGISPSVGTVVLVLLIQVLYPVAEFRLFRVIPAIRGAYEITGNPADAFKRYIHAAFLLLFQIIHCFLTLLPEK